MKELIYLDKNSLSPAGGPLGVGYYIYEEAKSMHDQTIVFLDEDIKKKEKRDKLKKVIYRLPYIARIIKSIRNIISYHKMFYNPPTNDKYFLNYDIVHFHSTMDMYKQRKNIANYKGKVLLTSHSPIPLNQELNAACSTSFERCYFKKNKEKFEEMDRWSFLNANYIIFPCPDAEEPYLNNWKEYESIKKTKESCYRYVLTGISKRLAGIPRNVIREKYSIDENDFVIVYAGRHNEVKGYNNLKDLGEVILSTRKDIKFLVAGKEGPLYRLENPSWIEIGFTKDPYSIIAAGDILLLPNIETYFDLVMIEALSLGKIVVASRTGGNKYYEKMGCSGVFLYDTLKEAVSIIYKIKAMPLEEREALQKKNNDFYHKYLTSKVFYENYKKLISEIRGRTCQ